MKKSSHESMNKRGKKNDSQVLQDADGFQAQGVSFEESAEKWRSGDTGKSARFYGRALEAYNQGLGKFPDSFDLAYNKARVLLALARNPRLSSNFPSTRHEALSEALLAHRRALQLRSDDADALFNTAQLLCLIVEDDDDRNWKGTARDGNAPQSTDLVALTQEAVMLLEKCLSIQEHAYQKTTHGPASQQPPDADQPVTAEAHAPPSEAHNQEQDTWAAIEEPITISSLVDTSVALLQAITTLCNINPSNDLKRLDDIVSTSEDLLQVRLSRWLMLALEEARSDYILAAANLRAALLEAQYRAGRISQEVYNKSLGDSFHFIAVQSESDVRGPSTLCAFADALLDFALAVEGEDGLSTIRWTKLTTALNCLTEASKNPRAQDLCRIHHARGDIELLRHSLSWKPDISENLRSGEVRLTILQNAEKAYRGATNFAKVKSDNAEASSAIEPMVGEAVAKCFEEDDGGPLIELQHALPPEHDLTKYLEGMVANSLISATNLELWKTEKRLLQSLQR
ncbi:MAG: hypothetical protein M1831_002232 [Alyxoria varia]|nr:MAG: hypothetical protein M1831_002232 [Alyxoria varia]